MSTSLAEQLQRLAGPQTSTLERGKKRASLLFDPKEAAGLRRDSVYEIGLSGLEELIAKNEVFEQFVSTLFSIPSKEFERSIETAENNKKLDKHIRKFMLLLSPYFMLTSSYKALEWLIYRYSVHEYNREDLLMLVLPYHESNIFARVVQLLKIKDSNDPWFFLKSLQKPGIHLPKQGLLNHAASDPYFIKFVSNFILEVIKVHENPNYLTIAFNFYCSVFTGAIEYSKEVTEPIITQMLPSLMKGLNSRVADFRAASYVIVARLVTKCTLSDLILDKFMMKIAGHQFDSLKEEAVLVYIVLYQSQRSYKNVPVDALDNIINQEWFPKILQNLNSGGSCIYPFLEVLLHCLVTKGLEDDGESYRKFTVDLLDQLKIDDDYVTSCLDAIINAAPSKLKNTSNTWPESIIQLMERQYPVLKDVENMLLERDVQEKLKAEDPDLVKEALGIVKTTEVIKGDRLKEILMDLLCKYYKDKDTWEKILTKVIQMLCIPEYGKDFRVILNVIPLLLPKTKAEIAFGKLVVKSGLFSENLLFRNFNKNANLINPGDFPNELFRTLKSTNNKKYFLEQLDEINFETLSPLQKFITAILMSNVISEGASLTEVLPFLEIFDKILKDDTPKSEKPKISILDNLKICKKGKLPITGLLECVNQILPKIQKISFENIDFSKSLDINRFLILMTSILYHDHEIYTEYIDQFNSYLFKNVAERINFMLHLAVFKKLESCDCLSEILTILIGEIKTIERSDEFFDLNHNLIPNILILMTNSHEEVRRKSISICEEMLKNVTQKKNSYFNLVKNLVEHQEEIIMDSKQIAVMVSNVVSKKDAKDILNALIRLCCNREQPVYFTAGISEVLTKINSIEILEKTSALALSILEKNCEEFSKSESTIIFHNMERYDESIALKLEGHLNATNFLITSIKNDKACLDIDGNKDSPTILLLKQLDNEFIVNLKKQLQFSILDLIIEISTTSQCPNVLLASNKLFKHLDLDVELILPQLKAMKDVYSREMDGKKKRRSVITLPTVDILDMIAWKKGVRVLELLQDKKKITNFKGLLPLLFDLLKKCLDFDEQAAVEYPKQLILSLILHCCQKLEGEKIPENVFNMELVVQCIRASPNPQTHHHALLVLAHCANLIPTQVLHHIMAIFTFMGSSVLRHDDAYSFQLIANIIDTIIPILVQDGDVKTIISVLRVFVDAILDVPEHRRNILYIQLLQKIQPERHLHIFLLLVFVSHVLHGGAEKKTPKHKFEDNSVLKRLDITAGLVREFPADVIFTAFINLMQYLRALPVEQSDVDKGKLDVDPSDLTPKQYRHFKYTILIFINGLISSKEFVVKIASLSNKTLEGLELYYKDMVVNTLSFIQKTNPNLDKYANTNQAQYWKAIQHQNLEILDAINALLTPEMFLLVIKGLMTHNLLNIRKRALDLLNAKLQNTSFVDELRREQLYDLINPLVAIVDKLNDEEINEDFVVIQTALLSLKLIIKSIGSEDPEKFIPLLEFVTNIVKSGKSDGNVLASLILCLAELCVTLRARAIQCLPNFMPTLLKLLKQQKQQESPTLLCLSLLTVFLKILESLALFISPYLKKILPELAQLSCKWESSTDPKLTPFVQKLSGIKQKLGENIAPRVLIPAIAECYADLVEKNKFDAIGPLMEVLAENLRNVSGPELSANLPVLTTFFIDALEFRSLEKCEITQTNYVENQVTEALTSLVLKLSETTFRPFFYKIYEWAVRCDDKTDKTITFYNVSCCLAKNLKSLFILFAGSFIKNASQLLDNCNKSKTETLYFENQTKNVLLLEKILETLTFVFKYTTSKFITKERFDLLMQPIVDQLENDLDGLENASLRNDRLLTPCIVQFAVATADDALWKQMNYQILLKMRNSSPIIRLMALKCLTEVVKQLGEDFLPLLPETIPFLSELLEDEEEIVEKSCKKSVQEMEKVLGENLQKYF